MKNDKWFLGVVAAFVVSLLTNLISIGSITGIPAHPLLLHTAVIFIPTLALATLAFVARPDWRKRYDIAWGMGAMVTFAATSLTVNAGGAWKDTLDPREKLAIQDHAELGDTLHNVLLLVVVLILIQIAVDRGIPAKLAARFSNPRSALSMALAGLLAVGAIATGVLTVAVGHEGAKVVFGHGDRADRGGPPPGSFQP
jgi:hypothetical protein